MSLALIMCSPQILLYRDVGFEYIYIFEYIEAYFHMHDNKSQKKDK